MSRFRDPRTHRSGQCDGCDRLADFARKFEGPLLTITGAVLCLVAWAFLAPRGPR